MAILENSLRSIWNKCSQKRRPNQLEKIGNDFLDEICQVEGCGRIKATSLMGLLAMFGLIPYQLMNWSSISHEKCGGYSYIKSLYPNANVKPDFVNKVLDEALKETREVFGKSFDKRTMENLLCEMNRQIKTGTSNKNDIFFKLAGRKGGQSIFRLKDTNNKSICLEMKLAPDLDDEDIFLSSKKNGRVSMHTVTHFNHLNKAKEKIHDFIGFSGYDDKTGMPKCDSMFSVIDKLRKIYKHKY